MKSKKIAFMKKSPLWLQFFSVSILLMFLVILVMTLMSIIQMQNKETRIIQSNISGSIHYTEQNFENALSRCSYQIGSQRTAQGIYDIKHSNQEYRYAMSKKVVSMCNEAPEIFAVFYLDNDGECYSAGEIFGSVSSQIGIINECKANPKFTKGEGLWRYANAGRNSHSLVWCKDITFVDSSYNQNEVGTVLLYIDAKRLSADFFDDSLQTYTAICDVNDTIALAQDETIIGKKFSDVFSDSDDTSFKKDGISYLYQTKNLSVDGWKIISYIETDMTGRNVAQTMTDTITIAFLGLILVFAISYVLSKRLGKPIEELLKYIRINRYGEITQMPEGDESDITKIRAAFDEMSYDLRKNIETNYEMQLKLNEITIKAYESQINPHFLFNTLYMIQMMNVIGEKENITTITNRLGKLLRFNLDNRNEVKLSEEIENVKNYLEIMELRFKGRFNYKIMIPPELMECYTVKFMLQPLIENSVSHGFVHKKDMCEIVIMGQQIGDDIAIVVKDNGQGITPEHLSELKKMLNSENNEASGIGIKNVHDRIQLLYGEVYGVDIFSDYAKNTNVLIHIPVSKSPKMEVEKDA